jgi:predicted Zn-dependent protease
VLGLAERALGQAASAAARLKRAARGASGSAWLHGWRGEALLAAGRPAPAAAALTRALELDPSFVDAWAWLGEARRRRGEAAAARAAFARALALAPGHRLALLGRGLMSGAAADLRAGAGR